MNNQDLLHGIDLIKGGNYKMGGQILIEIIKSEPNNELAWLWLSVCFSKPDRKIKCLNKVLEINPNNKEAKNWLALAKKQEKDSLQYEKHLTEGRVKPKGKNKKLLFGIGVTVLLISAISIVIFTVPFFSSFREEINFIKKPNPCNQDLLDRFLTTKIPEVDATTKELSELWLDMTGIHYYRKWDIQRKNESGCVVSMQIERNGEFYDYLQFYIYLASGRITTEDDEAAVMMKAFSVYCSSVDCLDFVYVRK